MSVATLMLFGAIPDTGNVSDPVLLKEYGVLVTPSAAYDLKSIKAYLRIVGVGDAERNSAFWESWEKIANSSDFQLLAEQLIHYISTYGLESLGVDSVKNGYIYIPKSVFVSSKPLRVRIIDAIPKNEIVGRCFQLLNSGMALAEDTIGYIIEALRECNYQITGTEIIKNKEAQISFYKAAGVLPVRGDELFRYLIHHFTQTTLVINSKQLRRMITDARRPLPFIDNKRMNVLAESFNRHKDLWMAMKKSHTFNRHVVNELSRLSKKLHKPMEQHPLNLVTSQMLPLNTVSYSAKTSTLPQLVRAYNALALRGTYPGGSVYRIRNGKQWTTESAPPQPKSLEYQQILLREIKTRFGKQKVYIEPFVDYPIPVSEKSFTGNIPNGTILRFPMSKKILLIGVHWDDPHTDLDFRADSSAFSLGWNTRLRDTHRTLMYSGDMTRAPAPYGATEWIYTSSLVETFSLKLNLYSGRDFSKHFKLMIGISDNGPNAHKQIPPQDIVASFDVPMTERQMNIGLLYPEKESICLMLGVASTGNVNVGRYNKFDAVQQEVYAKQLQSGIRLKDVVEISNTKDGARDLSLANVAKDSFLF